PHWITVDIAKLFHELLITADVEIIVPLLPEVFGVANQAPRHSLLEGFEGLGKRAPLRFAHEEVNVIRHHSRKAFRRATQTPQFRQRDRTPAGHLNLGEGKSQALLRAPSVPGLALSTQLDLYDPNLPKRIMAVAAPLPILE